MLKEIVNDHVVGALFFLIQNRILKVLKKVREVFFADTLAFRVNISNLFWDFLLEQVVNLSLARGYVIERLRVIAYEI